MRITFAPDVDEDGLSRVLASLTDATVEVTFKDGCAPVPDGYDRPITDFHPAFCDVVEVLGDSVDLSYDDGSIRLVVPLYDIEEIRYL